MTITDAIEDKLTDLYVELAIHGDEESEMKAQQTIDEIRGVLEKHPDQQIVTLTEGFEIHSMVADNDEITVKIIKSSPRYNPDFGPVHDKKYNVDFAPTEY